MRLAIFVLLMLVAPGTWAGVVVVDNRTAQDVVAQIQLPGELPTSLRINAGQCVPLLVDAPPTIAYSNGQQAVRHELRLESAYFFGAQANGTIQLVQIGIGDESNPADPRPLPGTPQSAMPMIPVKILVDEEEPSRRAYWERRLRDRVAAASEIMKAHAGVGFTVVAADEWRTDDSVNDFYETLRTFEEVPTEPAQLAIGFTSQYEVVKGRVHLGGTRGPLASHILMREWSQHVSENERMELLVHEFGHLLGAAHSPEATSVMRPVLGDRKARRTDFVVRFDPINTLAIAMVGEEIRRRRISHFTALTVPTKKRLADIYKTLAPAQPDDQSAQMLVSRLGLSRQASKPSQIEPGQPKPADDPRVRDVEADAVSGIISAIVTAARHNKQSATPLAGDELFNLYGRAAARKASRVPPEKRTEYVLAALCLAIDNREEFAIVGDLKDLASRSDSEGSRAIRRAFIGDPTMAGRRDVLKHFLLSAYLATRQGRNATETLGIAKEFADTRRANSGFSFVDLTADLAGIRFAEFLMANPEYLQENADAFDFSRHLPSLDGLPEKLSLVGLNARFGGPTDERFLVELSRCRKLVNELPVYAAQTPAF